MSMTALHLLSAAAPSRSGSASSKAALRSDQAGQDATGSFAKVLSQSLQGTGKVGPTGAAATTPVALRRRASEHETDLQDLVTALAQPLAPRQGKWTKTRSATGADSAGGNTPAGTAPPPLAELPASSVAAPDRHLAARAAAGNDAAVQAASIPSLATAGQQDPAQRALRSHLRAAPPPSSDSLATAPDSGPSAESLNLPASAASKGSIDRTGRTATMPTQLDPLALPARDSAVLRPDAEAIATPVSAPGRPGAPETMPSTVLHRAPSGRRAEAATVPGQPDPASMPARDRAAGASEPASAMPQADAPSLPGTPNSALRKAPSDSVAAAATAPTQLDPLAVPARDSAALPAGQEMVAMQASIPGMPTTAGTALRNAPSGRDNKSTASSAQPDPMPVPARDGAVRVTDSATGTTQTGAPDPAPGNAAAERENQAAGQALGAGATWLNAGTPAASSPVLAPAAGPASAAASGVPATPITAVLSPEVGSSEWGKALGQQMVQMDRSGHQVAELQLNPPGLGPLKVTLNMNNQQIEALFVSVHASVRAAVEAALPQLRSSLADSGISLGHTSVSADSQPQTAFSQTPGGQGDRPGYRGDALPGRPTPPTRSATQAPRPSNPAGVDTYA